jgi:1-acyl-sn-glycerol-3-phosphate acyltransferase
VLVGRGAQAIRRLGLDEISRTISDALAHDEATWEAQKNIPFHGKRLAEGFERLLFMCPECGRIGTTVTHRSRIYCSACGAEYALDVYGRIRSIRGSLPADNAADLNAWQLREFRWYIARNTGETLIRDECAHLTRSTGQTGSSEEVAVGTLILTRSALIIQNLCFPLSEVSGAALNFKSGLMFRHGLFEYLLRFDNPRVSVHKWGSAFSIITGSPVG